MRICFVTEDFYPNFIGGEGVYGYHLVSQLQKLGHKITILAEYRPRRASFWRCKKNIQLTSVPFCFKNPLILAVFEYLAFILKFRKTYFDIVHANQLSGLFFVLLKPKNVGKVIVSIHHTNYDMHEVADFWFKRLLYHPLIWLERIMYARADGLLFNSKEEEKNVSSYYDLKNRQTTSVYLGVEMPRFTSEERQKARERIRRDLKIAKDAAIVLYVGRLVKKKKINVLLSALSQLNESHENIFGIIIGRGKDSGRLKTLAPPNVIFKGFVLDTKPYFLAADLFVTTSVAEGGFLLTALEAASFGLPLILSPSAAGFPIIKEGINGFIISPDDPKLLADKIKRVIREMKGDLPAGLRLRGRSDSRSRQVGKESRKIARNFSWEKCAKETLSHYLHIMR